VITASPIRAKVYTIYLPKGGTGEVDLGNVPGEFSVQWYNPCTGGALQAGDVTVIESPGWKSIGHPPADVERDWVALVKLARGKPPKG
jgi:Putative collagen-binding domain of a collagenase